jgi:DNA-binding protein HU-beta
MNKQDLVVAIANQTELPKATVEKVVNSFMTTVIQSVVAGDHVQLIGFGSFNTLQRKARNGRNPATGKAIKIPAKNVPRFVPGKAFKEAVVPPKPAKKARAKK